MTNRHHAVLCGIAVGIACTIADISFAEAGWCWGFGCGTNSATVGDNIVFDELNSRGTVTPDNIRIMSAHVVTSAGLQPVRLNVKGHNLTAIDLATPTTIYSGAQLLDMEFTIGHRDGRRYDIKVTKVCAGKETSSSCKPLTFWVPPANYVPYYELTVKKTHTRSRPPLPRRFPLNPDQMRDNDDRAVDTRFDEQLCRGKHLNGDVLWTSVPNAAIFFEGDHYDPEHKVVTTTKQSDGWFNIACSGAAPAKMHLLRHSSAGSDSTHHTNVGQRTAMLKMLTADYCGDGKAWTADGTPLNYADARGWFSTPGFTPASVEPRAVESVWGPTGALCLNDPRRLARTTPPVSPVPTCEPPAVTRAEVVSACKDKNYRLAPPWAITAGGTSSKLPLCSKDWWANPKLHASVAYVMSANKNPWPAGGDYCGGATTTP